MLTRGRALALAAGGLGVGQLAGCGGGSGANPRGRPLRSRASAASNAAVQRFRSRPNLRVPVVGTAGGTVSGYVFLGPGSTPGLAKGPPREGPQQGPMIVDPHGELVWFRPLTGAGWAANVKPQTYRGQQVLTWWEGKVVDPGFGRGEGVILDSSYREVARVRAGNGRQADLHEFLLTPQGTALITCYPATVAADLSAIGGPTDGRALESIIQEVDVQTGRVLMEWHSLDHVPVSDSHQPYAEPYDYLHANSIDVLPDGNLLVSARATWTLYKLDRRSGRVIWRLGGKRSDFALHRGAHFAWQHDARQVSAGTITLFDDGAGPVKTESQSRGIALKVDETHRRVALARAYKHPKPLSASAMGNVQTLGDGRVFVGWGAQRYASEFDAGGALAADAWLRPGLFSYRAFRFPWKATPVEAPRLVARHGAGARQATLYVSWNGATEVTGWRVRAGTSADSLRVVGTAARRGFETVIPLAVNGGHVAVTAIDASGNESAASQAVRITPE